MNTASEFEDLSEEDEIRKKVNDTFTEKFTKSGLVIPDFITYRTLYEYEKMKDSYLCNMKDFNSVRQVAVLHEFYAISILKRDEYEFVVRYDAELLEHYGISRK